MGVSTKTLLASVAAVAFVACAVAQPVLLIPDSVTDSVGMYSPTDGTYLGDLILDSDPGPAGNLDTPIDAIVGTDGRIYVSDQVKDAVLRYDQSGVFIDAFCGPGSGLDNVRGIAFADADLLVCYASVTNSADRGVARFSPAGLRLPDFIGAGVDPFDVFLLGGDVLVSDIATNAVYRYDMAGNQIAQLFGIAFPEQISFRPSTGRFLNIAHNGNRITEFDLAGTLFATIPITSLGRGIMELDDGNFLMTNTNGVREINPVNGTTVRLIRSGTGFRYIERVLLGAAPCPTPGCDAGDLNGDCLVDLIDLTLFLSAFGNVGEPGSVVGDTNQDGVVDLIDLTSLLSQFGSNCAP
jgi:hypothetical protein